jgi:hypothetical protein
MLEKIFAPKAANLENHPEWLQCEGPRTNLDKLPEEIFEQTTGAEYRHITGAEVKQNTQIEIRLPEVEIPEHLPNWFDVMTESLDDLSEETALGNLAAVGKMGAHDPNIIKKYIEQIPRETLERIQEHCIELACEQAKKLHAYIMGREILDPKDLQTEQYQLKRLFNIATVLTAGGFDDLNRTLIQLESAHQRARQIQLIQCA